MKSTACPNLFEPFTAHLRKAGLDDQAAQDKGKLLQQACALMNETQRVDTEPPQIAIFVPGRIEFFGKHTDYAGGQSIICPTQQGFCFVARPRPDRLVNVFGGVEPSRCSLLLDPQLKTNLTGWQRYAATVVRRVARNFGENLCGADVAFASNLPPAAGMSSSSALIVGFSLLLDQVNGLRKTPLFQKAIRSETDLADYLACIENGADYKELAGDTGVGTLGGSEDHTAILCGMPGMLSRFAYQPTRLIEHVPMPADHGFVIASSGVVAEKTGAAREAYNRASWLVGQLVQLWNETKGNSGTLAQIAEQNPNYSAAFDTLIDQVSDHALRQALRDRLAHFLRENQRIVPAVASALAQNDLEELGRLSDRSQRDASRLLANQVPQTEWLAKRARELGASAASAFGAGFGGAVWALVPDASVESFMDQWKDDYHRVFPEQLEVSLFLTTRPGISAQSVNLALTSE